LATQYNCDLRKALSLIARRGDLATAQAQAALEAQAPPDDGGASARARMTVGGFMPHRAHGNQITWGSFAKNCVPNYQENHTQGTRSSENL
jgi:hypothetical protein